MINNNKHNTFCNIISHTRLLSNEITAKTKEDRHHTKHSSLTVILTRLVVSFNVGLKEIIHRNIDVLTRHTQQKQSDIHVMHQAYLTRSVVQYLKMRRT